MKPVTIRYGQVVIAAEVWPLYVAEKKGFLDEQAIKIDRTMTETGNRSVTTLVGGSVDIINSNPDVVITADLQGADIIMVGGMQVNAIYSLIVPASVKSYDDLRGKKMAVASIKDSSTLLLKRLLTKNGVKDGEYDLVQVGGTNNRYAALKTGAVSGAMLLQPVDFKIIDEGFKRLGLSTEATTEYPWALFSVKQSWAKANEEVLIRFLRGIAKACQWMYDPKNKEEAIKILVDYTKSDDSSARQTYELYIEKAKAVSKAGEFSIDGIKNAIQVMAEVGNLEPPLPDANRFVDFSYYEKAMRK